MITIVRKSANAPVEVQPKPTIQFSKPTDQVEAPPAPEEKDIIRLDRSTPVSDRAVLVASCWHEFSKTLLSRKALSNTIADALIRNAGQDELRDLYTKIKSYQPVLEDLYKRARYVEQHGSLPDGPAPGQPESIDQLRLKRKALVEERSKTKKKLSAGNAKPDKILEWQQKLDRAEAEYLYIDEQIKKFEGKA